MVPRTPGLATNRWNGIEHVFTDGALVDVGIHQPRGQRTIAPVAHQVLLRAQLSYAYPASIRIFCSEVRRTLYTIVVSLRIARGF
jgi:hypothetical protein